MSPAITDNFQRIYAEFDISINSDIIIQQFKINNQVDAFLVFIGNMADRKYIQSAILRPIRTARFTKQSARTITVDNLAADILTAHSTSATCKYSHVINAVLTGKTALFVDGSNSALLIETQGYAKREIEKPSTEATLRGSFEGFTETVSTNVTQIRRLVKNKQLIHETMTIGRTSPTAVSILYLKNIANPAVVREVKRRLQSIKTDALGGNGFTEQLIEDHPMMLFPQILTTERPDRTAFNILEGKVAILTEGSPFALIVPVSFVSMFQTAEEYQLRWPYATPLRLIRLIAYLLATFLPAFYLGATNYHQELLPTDLIIAIGRDREGVPFPTLVEIILLEVSWELIREAGIRVPGVIGSTLGIIGALILGQAAVAAKIVSPIMVIIVAVTGLGNFAIPNYNFAFALRLLRFFFLIMASIAGFFGISIGMLIVMAGTARIKSFGIPFMAPLWPKAASDRDLLVRGLLWKQEKRPDYVNPLQRQRQPKISRGWVKGSPPKGYKE
ncbi:spore germination protein [Heliophilum fasciatum]|uniref:spore germination protein n=1 Tax=Heliophilum fasciatum TaxID=35700 RepID=UPI002226C889|nr:spore germination protein [Heliophilum fasciatum]